VVPHELVHVSTLTYVRTVLGTPRVGRDARTDVVGRLEEAGTDVLGGADLGLGLTVVEVKHSETSTGSHTIVLTQRSRSGARHVD
jgi:hypothetical protein